MEITAFDVSASGMRSQRLRMETIANNLANAETTSANSVVENVGQNTYIRHTPYRRRNVVFMKGNPSFKEKLLSVSVPRVIEENSDFRKIYDPAHPHSVKNPDSKDFGYVYFPNVNPFVEMTDMMTALRSYEANVAALDTLKSMGDTALRIIS